MKESKSDFIYTELRQKIITGELKTGELINEHTIAEEYGVSKTPVRDALSVLTQQGYVTKFPRVGYYIKEMSIADYYDLLQYRYMLECGLIRYIIASCTDEEIISLHRYTRSTELDYEEYTRENQIFHLAFAALAKNKYISQQLENVFNMFSRWTSPHYFESHHQDPHIRHRELIGYLLERNIEKALAWEKREMIWGNEAEPYFV